MYLPLLSKRKRPIKFKDITEVQSFLRSVPYINHGGCGIAALVIYDYLTANNVEAEIVYAYGFCDPDYDNNLNELERGGDNLVACSHAMVRLKYTGEFHDCKGERDIDDWYDYHPISREMVVKSLKSDKWSRTFERSKYLPVIERAIGYDIKFGSLKN